MELKKLFYLLICILLNSCGDSSSPQLFNLTASHRSDTIHTEAAAMSIHRTEPARAMTLIDSAVSVGNITPGRGRYLKAVTLYGGMENIPSARQMCLDLLASEVDSVTLEETYNLLASIEYTSGHLTNVISYATEASRLAHELNMPNDVAMMEGYIAHALSTTGHTDEGIYRLRSAIGELSLDYTLQASVAFQNTSKKLINILIDNQRFADVVPLCEDMLLRLDLIQNHPERFSDINDEFDPAEYIDFARGQTLALLTVAYAQQHNASSQKKALQVEDSVFTTKWSKSLDCDKIMVAAYHYLGQYDRFEQALSRIISNMRGDTVNINYNIALELKSQAAAMQGQYAQALNYLQRASIIHDSLDARDLREQIEQQATQYHLQEEHFLRLQAETEAVYSRWLKAAVIAICVLAIAFIICFFHMRRQLKKCNIITPDEM